MIELILVVCGATTTYQINNVDFEKEYTESTYEYQYPILPMMNMKEFEWHESNKFMLSPTPWEKIEKAKMLK